METEPPTPGTEARIINIYTLLHMKKILLFTCMLVAGLCITSCYKDDCGSDENVSNKLDGLWACTANYFGDGDSYIYDNSTEYLLEFSNGIIKDYNGEECPFINGYITGSLSDFNLENVEEYQLKGNEIWIGGVLWLIVEFIDNDKLKLIDGDSSDYYSIYERIKGFK